MPASDRVGRNQGVLADWNDDRGFGFIHPSAGGSRVFVHVSAFPRDRRPASGCLVSYAEVRDERNRARASEVRYLTSPPAARVPHEVRCHRFKEVVHPSANVWMHHIELHAASQIDDQVRGWLEEAYANAG